MTKTDNGDHWSWHTDIWRVKISFNLYRHAYPASSDRWVLQPSFVYDCKEKND